MKSSFRRAAAKVANKESKAKYTKAKTGPATNPTSGSDSNSDDDVNKQSSSENLAKLPTLSEEEYIFFKLVRGGDLNGLKDFMKSDSFKKIHINKTDRFGFSGLHHAVRRQDEEMVTILLSQEGILTYDALFHAIQEENVPITLKLLKHEDDNRPPSANAAGKGQQNAGKPLTIAAGSTTLAVGAPSATLSPTVLLSPTKVSSKKDVQDMDEFDSEFPAYLTPLMKSAELGNAELMELFYSRGERLESQEENHNSGCGCRICSGNDNSFTRFTSSYERLSLFNALTNPKYICFLSSKQKVNFDPINYALDKITRCRDLIDGEQTLDSKYQVYVDRLGGFVRDFLDLCRTNEETEIFMSVPESVNQWSLPGKYPRLWKLVGLQLVNVVAHPHAQYIVFKQWASSAWPEWTTYGFLRRLSEVLIRVIFLPFIAIFLWFGSRNKWGKRLASPVSRYLTWVASYLIFLALVFTQTILPQRCNNQRGVLPYSVAEGACHERGEPNIGTEWPIILYVLGFYVSMLKRHSIPWLWGSAWTWYELVNQLLFTGTFTCWLVAWAMDHPREDRKTWGQYYPEILAEAFLSVSVIMSFGRAFRLIQLHQTIGPLQIALGRMVKSFFSVAFVYSIMIFSFSTGLNAIYVPYNYMKGFDSDGNAKSQASPFGRVLSSSEELFWALFGMSGSDKPHIVSLGTKVNDSTVDIRHHWVNELAGKFIFGSYNVLGVLMMFNMLVAYFSGHADKVFQNADAEWKFARTQIYMNYMKDTVLPPPFNLIPTLRGILRFFEYVGLLCLGDGVTGKASCSLRQCCFIEEPRDYHEDNRKRKAYRRLILQLTHRYKGLVVEKENREPATSDDVKEISEELAELKSQVESKLQELEAKQAETETSKSGPALKAASSEELDILKYQSTNTASTTKETGKLWSRTQRILFHKTSKGLVSKLQLAPSKKASVQVTPTLPVSIRPSGVGGGRPSIFKSIPPSPPLITNVSSNGGISSAIKFSTPPPPSVKSSLPPKPPAPISSGPEVSFSSNSKIQSQQSNQALSKSQSGDNSSSV